MFSPWSPPPPRAQVLLDLSRAGDHSQMVLSVLLDLSPPPPPPLCQVLLDLSRTGDRSQMVLAVLLDPVSRISLPAGSAVREDWTFYSALGADNRVMRVRAGEGCGGEVGSADNRVMRVRVGGAGEGQTTGSCGCGWEGQGKGRQPGHAGAGGRDRGRADNRVMRVRVGGTGEGQTTGSCGCGWEGQGKGRQPGQVGAGGGRAGRQGGPASLRLTADTPATFPTPASLRLTPLPPSPCLTHLD